MSDAMCRSGDSHYAGCACHEADWQERLAAEIESGQGVLPLEGV